MSIAKLHECLKERGLDTYGRDAFQVEDIVLVTDVGYAVRSYKATGIQE